MKKLLLALVALTISLTASASEERVIDQTALPQAAQKFIETYYPADKVAIATVEKSLFDKDYKVIMTSGIKLEFDGKGAWTEIECKRNGSVPMAEVHPSVAQYVKDRFPENKIVKIERTKKTIEVELNNDIDLDFNSNGQLIKFDN
ncbi:MAG: PepSY-like domain-containing protein [Bacteroidales bacterium]